MRLTRGRASDSVGPDTWQESNRKVGDHEADASSVLCRDGADRWTRCWRGCDRQQRAAAVQPSRSWPQCGDDALGVCPSVGRATQMSFAALRGLAWVETKHRLRHPAWLFGIAAFVLFFVTYLREAPSDWSVLQRDSVGVARSLLLVGAVSLLINHRAATRERDQGTTELIGVQPYARRGPVHGGRRRSLRRSGRGAPVVDLSAAGAGVLRSFQRLRVPRLRGAAAGHPER